MRSPLFRCLSADNRRNATMKAWLGKLYIQVLIGLILGATIGYFLPDLGIKLQPLADGFIKRINMLLAPIIFATIVVGIAKMVNLREVGRIGARALIYFEVVSPFALVIGLVVVNVLRPGEGMNIDPQTSMGPPSPAMPRR